MASKRFSRLIKILSGAAADAGDEIFLLEGRLERAAHFWTLVVRQFIRHRCFVRASALSYSTLIALIPLLVVALSVTSSLLKSQDEAKFQPVVEQFVAAITPPPAPDKTTTPPEDFSTANVNDSGSDTNDLTTTNTAAHFQKPETRVVTLDAQKEIASRIWVFVQNTQSAKLGATGVVLLIFVAVSLLGRLEETLNDIWGVTRGRNWLHQMQLYSTAIMLGPLLLITALGLAGGAQFQSAKDFVAHTPFVGKLIFQLLPLLVLWLAFAFIYLLLPNTKVKFSAALAGGAVAGTLWHLNTVFGFLYISRVVINSKIYGSLGLVPVFMAGIYISWVILLLGAQIAYACQNRAAYLQNRLADHVNQRGREFVALRLMTSLAQRFQNGLQPASILQLSSELAIPSPLTQSILRTLAHQHLVTEVAGSETAYMPARPLDRLNAHDVLLAMRTGTGQELPLSQEPALMEIYGEFARIEQAERAAASEISLLTLAARVPLRAALPEPKKIASGKIISIAPVAENSSEPEKVETTKLPMFPEKAEVEMADKIAPPRRDTVRPEENTEFPL